MSNFDFLKDFDSKLYKLGNRIEKQVNTSPSGVKADATTFLEHILKELLAQAGLKYNSRKPFTEQVDAVFRSDLKMSNAYRERIKSAYNYRNKIHDDFDEIEKHEFEDAVQLHEKLFYIARKFYRDYNDDYDEYKGVPDFKPLELDFSDDELEMVKIKDFNEIVDVKYDYCVVCGEPNHLNYSIYCHECSRKLDNSNNFISVRNAFGKDAKFTKEDLIEYGMPEGYVNQFINSMVRENMLKVAGRFITFKNMYLDEYLKRIDDYIAVGELITRFKEDKISPEDIRKSREYKLGSIRQEPFYQFYKIVKREIRKKFERDLLTTENIWESIDYTTITNKELERWYNINLGNYRKGQLNESFVVFNDLLMKDYLELKSEGIVEDEIRETLHVTAKVYDFWCEYKPKFIDELKRIKLDLISQGINEGKTRDEIIEFAGVTSKEYDDIFKVADRKGDEISILRKQEIESRKKELVKYLLNFDLRIACMKAKLTLRDFYIHFDEADVNSDFYVKTTKILMDKYLLQRSRGKTKQQALEITGIKEKYLNRWLSRSAYNEFKDRNVKVTVDLILKGFKQQKPLEEIAEMNDIKVKTIKSYVMLGERGSEIYKPLFDYYEEKIVPNRLDKFLSSAKHKTLRKALEASKLSDDEINKYYELGKSGDERFVDFYEGLFESKRAAYLFNIGRGKSHKIAMKESWFSPEEYEENKDDLSESLELIKQVIVLEVVKDKKTSTVAASKANVSVDEVYEWYFKGMDGEEDYVNFYENFHGLYVRPNINSIQKILDDNKSSLENLIRSNKNEFTKKDIEIWVKNGLLDNKVVNLGSDSHDDEDENKKSKFDTNEMLREMGVEDYDKISVKKHSSTSSILSQNDEDIEKLKKQILKK